jgi:hypothetical protein
VVCTAQGGQIGQNFIIWAIFRGSGIFWWKYGLFEVFQEFWTFTLSFEEDILALLGLATVLATFSKIWANFFPNFWSPCLYYKNMTIINDDCKWCHKLDHDS